MEPWASSRADIGLDLGTQRGNLPLARIVRLIGEDEEATVRALQELHAAVLPLIENHGGRIIDTAGDQVLAEFASVMGAVRGAVAVQRLVASQNGDTPPSRRLEFRIGINQGEIVSDSNRLYGDGINVAVRLQALARPGGIAISGRGL
jgi:adenylate cyclase